MRRPRQNPYTPTVYSSVDTCRHLYIYINRIIGIGEIGANRSLDIGVYRRPRVYIHGITAAQTGGITYNQPMFSISVKDDMQRVLRQLDNFDRRQAPFVIAKALTATARDAKSDLVAILPRVFDNPTPYTMNSIYTQTATKQKLESVVGIKSQGSGGTPAAKYLQPGITGGQRRIKRIERFLTGKGILPTGMAVVPARDAQLDAYGNVRRADYGRIISRLNKQSAAATSGRKTRRTKTGSGGQLFVNIQGSSKGNNKNLASGIWERTSFARGSAIKPLLLFVEIPRYRARFDFTGTVAKTVRSNFQQRLNEALQYAIATTR